MPPERNAPSGTSATIRRPMASRRSASSRSVASSSLMSSRADCPARATSASDQKGAISGAPRSRTVRMAPGGELVHSVINRMRRRHVAKAEIGREAVAIERGRPAVGSAQRLELGAEENAAVAISPIERLDAQPVADEVEHALAPVPQGDGEHADETTEGGFHAPNCCALDNDLGVAVAAKAPSRGLELGPKLGSVVDLAIVGHNETAA